MEFDQLRLFVDLVREQNFTKVAERNCITQPAVSLSIQKLEEELGTKLLERTTRKVLVTEEGRILYDYARDILSKAQEAKAVLQERQDKMVGGIRLATVHSIGLYELPASLKEFIRRYPQVNFHIEYQLSDQVYHSVADGEADLGLVAYPEPRTGVVTIPFFEDELVVICNGEHPLAGKPKVPLRELAGHAFVAFEAEIPTRKAIDTLFSQHGVPVEIRMQCDNIEILKKMVEVGLGISLVPLLSVREEARNGSLRVLHLSDYAVRRPLAIIHRKGKTLSRPQRAFVELLTTEGQQLLMQDVARGEDVATETRRARRGAPGTA
jgi:LysR family transcriptional regulator, transcriptional activator of the cysJI operon